MQVGGPANDLQQRRLRRVRRALGLGGAVLVVVGALYLVRTHVLRSGTPRPGLDDTRPVSARGGETAPPVVALKPGSHDADGQPAASLGRARAASGRPQLPTTAALPTTIEEAIESNPKLASDLACRDPTARFDMDYELHMIAGLRDCLAGRTHSIGKMEFVLFFDNDPNTRKGIGTGLEPRQSELSAEDDAVVLGCLKAYVVGSELQSSEKYGGGPKRYNGSQINLPLEDSRVYKQVREGTYTPGYDKCDYP
jgi:hypothetical protein